MKLLFPKFETIFLQYWSDQLFEPACLNVREKFLLETSRSSLSGVAYTVICLLLAQAMQQMMDAYSGSTVSSSSLLYEAIGFNSAYNKNSWESGDTDDRYAKLVGIIRSLQRDDQKFADLIERLIAVRN